MRGEGDSKIGRGASPACKWLLFFCLICHEDLAKFKEGKENVISSTESPSKSPVHCSRQVGVRRRPRELVFKIYLDIFLDSV